VRGITQRKVWKASTRVVVGELVQPVASNGRYYRCTVAGITGASEPAFPAGDTPKGATFSDGAATWEYVDKLRTFEVKDPGGETTFKVSRVVGAEEIKA